MKNLFISFALGALHANAEDTEQAKFNAIFGQNNPLLFKGAPVQNEPVATTDDERESLMGKAKENLLNNNPTIVRGQPLGQVEEPRAVGGSKDEHGCVGGGGYLWCEAKGKCLRPFEEVCEEEEEEPVEVEAEKLGGMSDEHGCIGSAGYIWCEESQKCHQPWLEDCLDGLDALIDENGCPSNCEVWVENGFSVDCNTGDKEKLSWTSVKGFCKTERETVGGGLEVPDKPTMLGKDGHGTQKQAPMLGEDGHGIQKTQEPGMFGENGHGIQQKQESGMFGENGHGIQKEQDSGMFGENGHGIQKQDEGMFGENGHGIQKQDEGMFGENGHGIQKQDEGMFGENGHGIQKQDEGMFGENGHGIQKESPMLGEDGHGIRKEVPMFGEDGHGIQKDQELLGADEHDLKAHSRKDGMIFALGKKTGDTCTDVVETDGDKIYGIEGKLCKSEDDIWRHCLPCGGLKSKYDLENCQCKVNFAQIFAYIGISFGIILASLVFCVGVNRCRSSGNALSFRRLSDPTNSIIV